MKAKLKPGYDEKRRHLADIIPIPTPFTLFITPSQLCNFKCAYCTHSLSSNEKKELGFNQHHLDAETFERIAIQAANFPEKFKRVLLTGLGEPLMNPQISDMIARLVELEVADKYEIFTNASLLTPALSEQLIEAGLTYLRISIQGVTDEKYLNVTRANVKVSDLIDNIRYFYERRGECKIYVKIIDDLLDDDEEERKFYDMFGDICDNIFIERLINAQPSMTEHYGEKVGNSVTFYGEESSNREVCPYIFYTLQTDADGNVFPCPPLGLPLSFSLGNVRKKSLGEIWNGDELKTLRLEHLRKKRFQIPVCGACSCYKAFTPKADCLDEQTEHLINRLS